MISKMVMKSAVISAAVLSAAATASADLTVDLNLGTIASSTVLTLSNTTVGQTNEAFAWTSFNNAGTTLWGNGEYVYEFTLESPAFIYLRNSREPDADGSFPDPNHDYLLLNTLTTFNSNNTATSSNPNFPNFNNRPEGTSLAAVQNSIDQTSVAGSLGVFRNATTNPFGIWEAGTYYLAVDSRSGTLATFGQPNQLPGGNFTAELNIKYLDEVTPPPSAQVKVDPAGKVTDYYSEQETIFVSFEYKGGPVNVNTIGSDFDTFGDDTNIALYDSAGRIIAFHNDVSTADLSSFFALADGALTVGETYYLGFASYKGDVNPAFDMTVFSNYIFNPPFNFNFPDGTMTLNGLRYLADLDYTGHVDFADLGILLGEYGLTAPGLISDTNDDGDVDFDDLGILLGQYGIGIPPPPPPGGLDAAVAAVPEPSTMLLAGLAAPALLRRRRVG